MPWAEYWFSGRPPLIGPSLKAAVPVMFTIWLMSVRAVTAPTLVMVPAFAEPRRERKTRAVASGMRMLVPCGGAGARCERSCYLVRRGVDEGETRAERPSLDPSPDSTAVE